MRREATPTSSTADKLDPDTRQALRRARLKYANPDDGGIARRTRGRQVEFIAPDGRPVRDDATLRRIRKLAVPPAWKEVAISSDPRGHIQAVGRDERGRKQYRYHEDWRKVRDDAKYDHVIDFARALPLIRRTARRHLRRPGLPKEKVLAAVVLVMEKTLIRVGNDEYARQNKSFGLTTLRDRHVKVRGRRVRFRFRGKSGVEHDIDLSDPTLARIVRQCQELPGQELFQYLDADGRVCDVGSADVNDYLRSITGRDFTAKDYRTWAGTVLAAKALRAFSESGETGTKTAARRHLVAAIESVARRLGNTKAVCRKCYIHPAVLTAYVDGELAERLKQRARAELRIARNHGLDEDEAAVLRMLEKSL
jgi:DNA topoisomerase-1